jgi:hypothetical protein
MSREHRLSLPRLALIIAGGIGAGLVVALAAIGTRNFAVGSMDAGQDAFAYWHATQTVAPYGADAGSWGAYLYSPAFLQILSPILALPWPVFFAIWTGIMMAALLLLTGPVLLIVALPVAFFEIWGGNIHILLALAIVLGFRWPATWSFVLLTKVTPGVGLIWFAVRREWRSLAIALGATAAIAGISLVINPGLWQSWIDLLLREAGGTASSGHIPIPLLYRLPFAVILAVYAARTDRKWLVPVVCFLAMPVLWWGSVTVLIGCIAVERERVERFVLARFQSRIAWWRAKIASAAALSRRTGGLGA